MTCRDCGATLDAFEALMALYNHIDQYREYQEKALEKSKLYAAWADKEWRKWIRNKAFKDMDRQYHDGMLPHCPKCGEAFDPMEIRQWTNRKYCDMAENKDSKMEKFVARTANDETPICSHCDNNDIGDEFCLNKCGAKHGWGGYERAEFIESEVETE